MYCTRSQWQNARLSRKSEADFAPTFTGRSPHLDIVGSAKPFKGFAFLSIIAAAFASRADNPRYRLGLLPALDDWRKVAHRLDAVARHRRLRGNYDPADSRFSILLEHVRRWPFICRSHHQRTELELFGIASHLLRHLFYLRYVLFRLPRAESAGAPTVGVACNALERVLGVVRSKYHWYAGLLHGLGVKPNAWKLDYLAVVARFVLAPQLAHRLDRFAQMLPAPREVHSHDRGLFGKPPGADAQDKPSVRVVVDGRGHLRGFDRIALRQQAYHSAELDPLRRLRRNRERNERVGKVAVELRHFA